MWNYCLKNPSHSTICKFMSKARIEFADLIEFAQGFGVFSLVKVNASLENYDFQTI